MEQKEFNEEISLVTLEKAKTNKKRLVNSIGKSSKRTRVTDGGYGVELETFTKSESIPNSIIKDLKRSAEFIKLAKALDRKYVGYFVADDFWAKYDKNGRIVSGSNKMPRNLKGKRALAISSDPNGAKFITPHSPSFPKIIKADYILLKHNKGPQFVQELVHESCHAYNFVYGRGSAPKNLVDAIRADTQEEIKVRKREDKILSEINRVRKPKLKFSDVGSFIPALVGRDFSPGLGLTYIENSFFSFRLRFLQKKEGLSNSEAESIRDKVSKNKGLPFMPRPDRDTGLRIISEYGKTWSEMLKAKKSWKAFHKSSKRNSSSAREALIQKHAKLFFRNLVRYSKLP